MIEINVPGWQTLQLDHLVCDVNGTLAVDGRLIDGVARAIAALRDRLTIHLVTADTHGRQQLIDQQLGLNAIRLQPGNETMQKEAYVRQLNAERVAAIGQGANDERMLAAAGLGIAVLSLEGTYPKTFLAADLIVPDILSAFTLLEKPIRIMASLRR